MSSSVAGAKKFVQRFVNANPRNMERLRLQRPPDGWDFERDRALRNFIYRFLLYTIKYFKKMKKSLFLGGKNC
jgi:hypothetical protein